MKEEVLTCELRVPFGNDFVVLTGRTFSDAQHPPEVTVSIEAAGDKLTSWVVGFGDAHPSYAVKRLRDNLGLLAKFLGFEDA